jgi:hypothetical protein
MMEPLISIQFAGNKSSYQPGELLECDYQIDAIDREELQAIEASVLWYTEGKGDEDMAVHYFERRVPADAEEGDLRRLRRLRTALPNSPRSYTGMILNIRWCVRVRVFLPRGRHVHLERPFQLGTPVGARLPPPVPPPAWLPASHQVRT